MASLAAVAPDPTVSSRFDEALDYYLEELAKPAPPPETYQWPPETIGPTWQVGEDGRWLLPDKTLGWQALGWCAEWLQHGEGEPWRFTLEQARFILWWYAVDDDGRFLFRDGVLQRLKGWGKDPLAACICAIEMVGPCRFGGWDEYGEPIAVDNPDAWIQTAAVSLKQTKNTMRIFPTLFSKESKGQFGIVPGKEQVHGLNGRIIEAVTSSPSALEGSRASLVILNETHHWKDNNSGHEMAAVIQRNATKSVGGAARTLRITNAYEPSQDSVAQQDREAFDLSASGGSLMTGFLYDSLEAPPDAPLSAEAAPEVMRAIRGDAHWLDIPRIVQSILDTREPPSRSRRFWYNQITADEDAWVDPANFDLLASPHVVIDQKDEIVVFFDGSKSDDATGLVGCRVSDGHVFTIAMWQKPPGGRGDSWTVNRRAVDLKVTETFDKHNVIAFWADPSHTLDDESQERYWDHVIDEWHRRYKDRLRLWAVPGISGHSIMWDMVSSQRNAEFTAAAERVGDEIDVDAPESKASGGMPPFTHDGDARLVRHVRNCRRYPNKFGVSVWKGHRESPNKIDLAVCMIGARMLRRNVLNAEPAKKRTGRIW